MRRIIVTLSIDPPDDSELDWLTRQLAHELSQLDSVTVERKSDTFLPSGAKGTGSAVGTVLLTLSGSAMFGAVQIVRAWIARDQGREVTVKDGGRELHLKGMNAEHNERMVREFLDGQQADSADLS